MKIENLYDSHVHWQMTGESRLGLRLHQIKNKKTLRDLKIETHHRRGNWIVGFGWDENHFDSSLFPHRKFLDECFPDEPVFFTRVDGHSCWVNTKGLKLLGFDQSQNPSFQKFKTMIRTDENGIPNGILDETAHMRVYEILPPQSNSTVKSYLKEGMNEFLKNGFTHIRDMTGGETLWTLAHELENEGDLNFFAEINFNFEKYQNIDQHIEQMKYFKTFETKQLKLRGVKIFYDGSLGSHSALLSQDYGDQPGVRGMSLWEKAEFQEVLQKTWHANLDLCVHTIGDQAVHDISNGHVKFPPAVLVEK